MFDKLFAVLLINVILINNVLSSISSSSESSDDDSNNNIHSKYSISGFSCGARFSHAYLLSYSSEINSVWMGAGTPVLNTSTIYNETSFSEAFSYWFDNNPTKYNLNDIISWIDYLESQDLIDNLSNLINTRIHIYRASSDIVVPAIHAENLVLLYNDLTDGLGEITADINNKNFNHFWITPNYGQICQPDTPLLIPFMCKNNDFNFAQNIFEHIFLGNILNTPTILTNPSANPVAPNGGQLVSINVGNNIEAFQNNPNNKDKFPFLSNSWNIFIPRECVLVSKLDEFDDLLDNIPNSDGSFNYDILSFLGENDECALHVDFHGGNMGIMNLGNHFNIYNGLNIWADVNKVIILYPTNQWTVTSRACWDFFGYTGIDYFNRNGAQISIIHEVINQILFAMENN